jgi:hypothetical protein
MMKKRLKKKKEKKKQSIMNDTTTILTLANWAELKSNPKKVAKFLYLGHGDVAIAAETWASIMFLVFLDKVM